VLAEIPAGARAAAEETLGGAAAAAAQLPEPASTHLITAARDAFTHALVTTTSVCAAVAAATAVAAVVLLRVRTEGEPAGQPEVAGDVSLAA
jgi:DHA2 family multidrug resistance protein-like MFS transporter